MHVIGGPHFQNLWHREKAAKGFTYLPKSVKQNRE